jgi:hypothetical protein
MKLPVPTRLALASGLLALLSACGGGGSDGGSSGGGGGGGVTGPTPPSEASTGLAAPTRPTGGVVGSFGSLFSDVDKARRLVSELNAMLVRGPALVATQKLAAVEPAGSAVDVVRNCASGGTVRLLPLVGGNLDLIFANCQFDGYAFGPVTNQTATRSAMTATGFNVEYGGMLASGPGIAPANSDLGAYAAVCRTGTGTQCTAGPLYITNRMSAGYDFAYAGGAINGTVQCDCFGESAPSPAPVTVTMTAVFTNFNATSGTAQIFTSDGWLDVERQGASSYRVVVNSYAGGTQTYSGITPLY